MILHNKLYHAMGHLTAVAKLALSAFSVLVTILST